ncbi:hypothetical protein BAUCODRAFT_125289 [Baudoinia panamericana UAMH 10762]|uniref:Aspartate/glutamate racemase family protein n=1 Tax=Baudoinia panamericana (strain UAMH 10762) TaxID=717646 RepID=M2MAD0_BAUPA|nr:uncharacterized protein BAUCODRAFT_125289 [Baudoinia panamericana UAMH 10762]EMC93431.1 hypothetical protein BAUCODRAFT_125289 [Baudoinia panamericana UAMH 10762]
MAHNGLTQTLPPMGFIAVQCYFHRPPGDAWNEQTWPFPLIRETAEGSKESQLVIGEKYDDTFINNFVEAGKRLADRGAVGILTSCGFLAMAQPLLAERLPIPISTSALVQVPSILAFMPQSASVGILTYNGEKLNFGHLQQLGVPDSARTRVHIVGAPSDGYLQNLVREKGPFDREGIESELVRAATALVTKVPSIQALVLECTQMPPYAEAIQAALNGKVRVYDVHTMGCWFYSGLVNRTPREWLSNY